MARREELTDERRAIIKPLIPDPPRRTDGRERPWRGVHEGLNGILWILRSSMRWQDLPECLPPDQTCHRHFQQWVRNGTRRQVLKALAEGLRAHGELDVSEWFIDGTCVITKKEARDGSDPAGQTDEAPGGGRPRWSSCRRPHGRCYAT